MFLIHPNHLESPSLLVEYIRAGYFVQIRNIPRSSWSFYKIPELLTKKLNNFRKYVFPSFAWLSIFRRPDFNNYSIIQWVEALCKNKSNLPLICLLSYSTRSNKWGLEMCFYECSGVGYWAPNQQHQRNPNVSGQNIRRWKSKPSKYFFFKRIF